MNMRKMMSIMAATTMLSCATPVLAQTTPAFRVPIGQESAASTVNAAWIWAERVSSCDNTCGPGKRMTTYECQNAADFDFSGGGYGLPEPEANCSANAGPKPASDEQSCSNYSGCSYDWVKPGVVKTPVPLGSNPVGRIGCGNVNNVFSPYCQRGTGGTAVQMAKADYRFCSSDTPDYNDVAAGQADALGYDRTLVEENACNTTDHFWTAEPVKWNDSDPWSSECSNTATQTRVVTCTRRFDGSKPANPDAACGTADKPAASRTGARYGSCSYKAVRPGAWGDWASTCSASTTRTRTNSCQRINAKGEIVTDDVATSECTSRGIQLTETETGSNYAGCTSSWKAGEWSGFSSSCSPTATRARPVTCNRDLDGAAQPDASCTASTRPISSESQGQYGGCTYNYALGDWSNWSSNCSNTSTRTRSVVCQRSDGASLRDSIPDNECTSRGIGKPASSETQGMYGSCSYTPRVTGRTTCTMQKQQTVTWGCTRDLDGVGVATSYCGKPASEVVACTPAYTWDWTAGAWSGYSSGCSATANRTRTVTCQRNDGAADADQNCNAATRPASSETVAQYGSCGYNAGGAVTQGAWSSTCSANATRTSTSQCVRSDGAVVANAECTNRGIALTTTQTTPVYSGCGYSVESSNPWSACTPSGTQTRSVTCRRSDGTVVDNSFCGNNGTQTQACTYTPSVGNVCGGGQILGVLGGAWTGAAGNPWRMGNDAWASDIGACNQHGGNCVQDNYSVGASQEQGGDRENRHDYVCYKDAVGVRNGTCMSSASGGCSATALYQPVAAAGSSSYCSGGTYLTQWQDSGDFGADNGGSGGQGHAASCKAAGGNCLERRYDHTVEMGGQEYSTTTSSCYKGATVTPVAAGTGTINLNGGSNGSGPLSSGPYGWCNYSYGGGQGQEHQGNCLRGADAINAEPQWVGVASAKCQGGEYLGEYNSFESAGQTPYGPNNTNGYMTFQKCADIGGTCFDNYYNEWSEYGVYNYREIRYSCYRGGSYVEDPNFYSSSLYGYTTNDVTVKK
jgi:hypothetical protein